jgi:hypothetical protein
VETPEPAGDTNGGRFESAENSVDPQRSELERLEVQLETLERELETL